MNRVLILSASAGAGHLRAADALEKGMRTWYSEIEQKNVDTLKYTNKLFERMYSKAYIDLVNKAPAVLGWLYESLDTPWENESIRLAFDKLNTKPLMKLLQSFQPDLCLCTHFLPAEIISWLKAKNKLQTKLGIVVTDFHVHAMWLCRNYDYYFVACDENRAHLEALGVSPSQIIVSGIAVDPLFAEQKGKSEMRVKRGLDPERPTLLLSAGGFGVGSVAAVVETLSKVETPIQVIAVCGRNKELYEQLSTKSLGSRHILKVVGFTTEMDELMAASDLIVGKPGGLTTSEALARGLVYVVFNPIPGQEERNSDYLLEEGAAVRCGSLLTLPYKIDKLLRDPIRMESLRRNTIRIGKPNAARTILTHVLAH